ncbi:hypothetical protein TNCV_1705861 [Trichonephila clavipes]|nr:hypothetical protein TNCV_1705861 [Trichonephila clavipes]
MRGDGSGRLVLGDYDGGHIGPGRESIEDDKRSGRPMSSSTDDDLLKTPRNHANRWAFESDDVSYYGY